MPTAIVCGAIANKLGNGGEPWIRLSWALGLKRLGFDVCFVEQIARASCRDTSGKECPFQASANLAWFRAIMERFGLADSCALISDDGEESWGLSSAELLHRAKSADLLLNISGHLTFEALKRLPRHKVFLDEDPGFTQIWRANGIPDPHVDGHDFYFTLGANIGSADCAIPTVGIQWRHTRSPVVLEDWPVMPSSKFQVPSSKSCQNGARVFDRFTTVASWRGGFGPVQHEGKTYGLKVHEFRKFIELPRRGAHQFEIALQIHPGDKKDLDGLLANGWHIVDPKQVANSPDDFRRYIQNSGAEFSVAQGVYVDTNSGWFSDRTVRYLASGKPALVQETGFSRHLPVGEGLVSFRTLEEAAEGADRIARDYERHCRAARRIAEEYFDSDKVIGQLLGELDL